MASRIAGITIEIGGDTTNLQKSLKGLDTQLKTTENNLKDINRLLKLDPKNTELLTQKQKNLKQAIGLTKDRIEELRKAQKGVKEGTAEWDALQREIVDNEQKLKGLKQQYREFGSVASQQLKAVGQSLKDTGAKIEGVGKKLAPVSGAAAAIGGGLLKLGYNAMTSADELGTLSKQTGISTDELQKMSYAADLVDVSVESITGALRKMKTKMDPANETFAKLGVSVTNADGSLRDATDVFYDSIQAISEIENETERDQVAMELFGKGADELAGIIDDGGAALKEYGNQAEDLGLILDKDTIEALNDTNDTFEKTKQNVLKSLAQVGTKVATVLTPLLDKVSDLIGKVTERLRALTPAQTETILKVVGIVAAVAPAIIVIGKIVSGIGSIISVIGSVVGLLGGPLTIAIVAIVAVGILLYKNWDKIKETAKKLYDGLKKTWENIKTAVVGAVTKIKDTVSRTWDNIKTKVTTTVSNVKNAVSTGWSNIKATTSEKWESIKSTVASKAESIKESASAKFSDIVSRIKSIFSFDFRLPELRLPSWEDIKAKLNRIIDDIKNLFRFDWKLPDIKLPHFKINGGRWPYGLGGQGTFPSISVEWYRRAYENPMMFTRPTVMATPGGMKGFGDGHGAEIVLGLNKLRELVGASGVTVNVYASAGQSAKEIAYEVQRVLVNQQKQRSRAYA